MSYQLETNTDSSKIIHLNTKDADTYLQTGITTYCSFVLDTPIVIDQQHSALISPSGSSKSISVPAGTTIDKISFSES